MKPADYHKPLPVCELYPCIQGEGRLTGVPHILIRFTGCALRCQFAETEFCDSPYTSWLPEKGKITMDDFISMMKENPQIKHVMVTGGSPTLHPEKLIWVTETAKAFNMHITIETEGSKFVQTSADLISLSPKLRTSRPRVGTASPAGKTVTQKDFDRHEKNRANYMEMHRLIGHHAEYQLKPVITCEEDLDEVKSIQQELNIPNNQVYLMPCGQNEEQLTRHRKWMEAVCIEEGYNYCERLHVIIHGDKRGV